MTLQEFLDRVATNIPDKWKLFGIALGLEMNQVNAIGQQYLGDPQLCLAEVFNKRQSSGPISWATIFTALCSPSVGYETLANEIEQTLNQD